MKKLLSYIGVAAIVGAALIVAGCTRSDSETNTAADQSKTKEPTSSDQAVQGDTVPDNGEMTGSAVSGDDAYQDEVVPEDGADQIMALYGMPPVDMEEEQVPPESEVDGEIKELEKIPDEYPVRAIYGINSI